MRTATLTHAARIGLAASLMTGLTGYANADVITDWNVKAGEIVMEAKLGPPPANRVMAIVQTAVYEAANAVTQRYPVGSVLEVSPGASLDAAVAAANRATLTKLMPSQQASIDAAYQAALMRIADGSAKTAGIATGEKAAAAILVSRADDGAAAAESYRPAAAAGVYVPTALPAVTQWPQRKPWLMSSASQFRPAPPPALTSEVWARDYNEIKNLGARSSTHRTAEQTEIARFWEFSLPSIYHGVVRSVAHAPGRDATQNARLFAAVAQAQDDAMIAVFEAKYHYNFWRPTTAIRNGDIDGNDATERVANWTPLIDNPLHPEYPSAHSILAGAVAAVLQAEVGPGPTPALTTTSPSAKGATRRWTRLDDFTQEVANARIYEGIHYRVSTEVGVAMGKRIGELAAAKMLREPAVVNVPEPLKPGANEMLAMIVPANGVQIYECRAAKDRSAEYEWAFVAPEAELFDTSGKKIGRHYAGPHWEASDGSKFIGTMKARADAPAVRAIPWLLLAAQPVAADGSFGNVTSVQRVNTVGGAAPAAGCSQATAGKRARVDYTADYYFFTTREVPGAYLSTRAFP
ncbi:MAG: DUF3455 domain-containing protein [Pseudomonadota bacterium]